MTTITIEGGPLDVARPPATLQVFLSEGPDTVNRHNYVDRTVKRAAYTLVSTDPPVYRYLPRKVATNGLCEPVD